MNEPATLPRPTLTPAAVFLCLGLALQTVTLFWSHPTAFLVFIGGGGLLVTIGILAFLRTLFAR